VSSAEPKLGDIVGEKYELEGLLGRGGMGAVYRARHRITDRTVALKWLLEDDASRRARFLREAKAMGRLSHPNVIGILDVGDHQGAIFLVMDYLEGKSLREVIEGRTFTPKEAVGLLMPALSGVAAAHQAGILHRDLKPENLFALLDEDGHPYDVKVLDFGVAKPVSSDAMSSASLTHTGVLVGTPRYMAPEQLGDEAELDARCDVYALGIILYELLMGKVPYKSKSLNALLIEIMTIDIESPTNSNPEIPAEFSAILLKALARPTEERWPDVASFARALEPWGDGVRFETPKRVHTPKTPIVRNIVRASEPDSVVEPLKSTAVETPAKQSISREEAPIAASVDAPKASSKLAMPLIIGGVIAAVLGVIVLVTISPGASPAPERASAPPPEPAPVEEEEEAQAPEPIAAPEPPPPEPPPEILPAPEVRPAPEPVDRPRVRRPREQPVAEAPAERPVLPDQEPLRVQGRSGTMERGEF
jgi:serine/threonine protein kinase